MNNNERLPGDLRSLLKGRRILVVEDEYFLAHDMQEELEHLGVEVVGPVGTVSSALSVIEEKQGLDAAILDVNISGEMVFPIADELHRRGIPFVFATEQNPTVVHDRYPGFVLCRKPAKIGEIAHALFGGGGVGRNV